MLRDRLLVSGRKIASRHRKCVLLMLISLPVIVNLQVGHAEQLPVKSYTIADGLARDYINRIKQDSHGFIWFCTTEGISRFDGYGFTNYGVADGLPHRVVNDLLETRDGAYLVATSGGGLVEFDPAGTNSDGSHFTVVNLGQSELSRVVSTLIEDETGVIWCGTFGGGNLFIRPRVTNQKRRPITGADPHSSITIQQKSANAVLRQTVLSGVMLQVSIR